MTAADRLAHERLTQERNRALRRYSDACNTFQLAAETAEATDYRKLEVAVADSRIDFKLIDTMLEGYYRRRCCEILLV